MGVGLLLLYLSKRRLEKQREEERAKFIELFDEEDLRGEIELEQQTQKVTSTS